MLFTFHVPVFERFSLGPFDQAVRQSIYISIALARVHLGPALGMWTMHSSSDVGT